MNDGPGKRKERDLFAFELKKIKAADAAAVLIFKVGEENFDLHLDKLIVAAVDDAKHQPLHIAVWRYDGDIAKNYLRRRACKPGKNDTRDQRVGDQAVIRFDGDKQIRNDAGRMDRAVADGRECLHAKKEAAEENICHRLGRRIDQG